MKKSERLNDMIRYLNHKEYFNLHELMEHYHISKSTALRDIRSLEELGMPLFAEHGRHGRYGILKNRLLSPIIFSMDEVYALYFAMLTLNAYQSTPFHLSVNQLHKKFESCLSAPQLQQIHNMKKVLQLEVSSQPYPSAYLDQILQSILNENNCRIEYTSYDASQPKTVSKVYTIQFFKITARFGQWYATGIDPSTDTHRVFRCDRITTLELVGQSSSCTLDELLSRSLEAYRSAHSIPFTVTVNAKGKDLFYKEPYPSMQIYDIENELSQIDGFYNPDEETFIADYFIRFGRCVTAIQSESLKNSIQNRLNSLSAYYEKL